MKSLVFCAAKSAVASPRVLPVAAYASASTASRPEFEYSGWVWPSLKAPHSAWPYEPQPLGSFDTLMMSLQPMSLFGQPSASAIGRHIAITIGESTSGSPDG